MRTNVCDPPCRGMVCWKEGKACKVWQSFVSKTLILKEVKKSKLKETGNQGPSIVNVCRQLMGRCDRSERLTTIVDVCPTFQPLFEFFFLFHCVYQCILVFFRQFLGWPNKNYRISRKEDIRGNSLGHDATPYVETDVTLSGIRFHVILLLNQIFSSATLWGPAGVQVSPGSRLSRGPAADRTHWGALLDHVVDHSWTT